MSSSRRSFEEMLRQGRQVLQVFGERRRLDAKDGESIKEIGAEAALLCPASERLMRRRHNANVDAHRLVLAYPLQFPALEKTQQLGLKRQWHLANLIQKQRAAVRRFNSSCPALYGASERAARMAEKLGLQQCLRDGGAVQRNEGPVSTRAQAMESTRHYLLPGPRRTLYQDRGLPLRNQTNTAAYFEHSVRVSNQLRQPYGGTQFQNGRRVSTRTRRRLPGCDRQDSRRRRSGWDIRICSCGRRTFLAHGTQYLEQLAASRASHRPRQSGKRSIESNQVHSRLAGACLLRKIRQMQIRQRAIQQCGLRSGLLHQQQRSRASVCLVHLPALRCERTAQTGADLGICAQHQH